MIDKNLDQINNVFEKKSSIKEISSSKKTLPRSFGLKYVTSLFVASFGVVRVFVSKMIFAFR
ncbi:hypothetical protein OC683_01685 ['Crotalaria aegyptiaca' phytoplasma]|uniref:Preprotein translocase subunit SecE n=1 Tax=Candidatus Phytoplasma crotalariae TaxID=2982627 RepID=A0ABT9D2T1_9MOLU|nr:hypothetical protein ['Crotalaria aegyptiaca' phytoplasma]MDO8059319.1 hypothetical protein ['Crotalaria aegyptiaca' phytoplasma]